MLRRDLFFLDQNDGELISDDLQGEEPEFDQFFADLEEGHIDEAIDALVPALT